jgi:long-chain fatty acid transport protein
MRKTQNTKLVAALMLAFSSGYVAAAGFQLLEQNVSGLGNSYAGSAAVAENASTIFFNPAGMTQLKDREFSVGVAAIGPSFKFSNSGSSVGGATGFGNAGNGGDAGGWAGVPNAYLSWALNKDLYVGVGLSAPFGLKTEYSSPWIGSAQSNSFSVETMNINPSIAYRVNDAVSVGGGVSWQHIDAKYKRLAGSSAIPLPGTAIIFPQALTTTSTVTATLKGDAWGWNVGGLFTVTPVTKVGVSYRSTVTQDTTGDITVTGASTDPLAPTFFGLGTSGAKASLKLPDTAILSATHQLNNKWQLLGDVSWTGWSSIPKLDLVRTSGIRNGDVAQSLETDFRDTWRAAVGGNYQYSQAMKLKFGLAYDQTPVKGASTRMVSLPDSDRTQISTGAQWALSGGSTLDVGLAYLMFDDASINNNQLLKARGLVKGSYSGSAWILGAQYSMPF